MINSLLDFFIENAQAAVPVAAPGAVPPGQSGGSTMLIVMLAVVAMMYVMVWRPQNKRAKEHKDLLSSIAVGDEVVTMGGILGKVSKLVDNYFIINIAPNVDITVQKSSIANVLPKGTLKSV
jgi:preprotein translocase subunit YajC